MSRNRIIAIAIGLVVFGVAVRLMPHAPNATPITAITLVSGLYLGRRWSILLPCVTLFLSDIAIGLYDARIMLSVYGSFVLIGCIGWINRKYAGILPIGFSVLASSLLFFAVTNAAVWLFSPWYEKSISGLFFAYEMGIPFFRNMLAGDLIYTTALIVVFESLRYVISIGPARALIVQDQKDQPA